MYWSACEFHSSIDSDVDGDILALIEVYLGPRVNRLHSVQEGGHSIDSVEIRLTTRFFTKLVAPVIFIDVRGV